MNNEERELINNFFDRVGGKTSSQPGSVPMTNQLPPVDIDADKLIKDNFLKYPDAGYRVTQMAVVQEAALAEAQNRIRQLEWQLHQATQQLQQTQQSQQQSQQSQPSGGAGFLGGLFGGNRQQQTQQNQRSQQSLPPGWGGALSAPQMQGRPQQYPGQQGNFAAPPPNYPPGYQPGMFNRGGTGFLGSALTTAAGVAGGMFAYNALSGLFGGHNSGAAVDPMAGAGPDPFAGNDPFSGEGTAVDPNFDAGMTGNDAGFADSGWDNAGTDSTGFDDGADWGGSGDDSGWGDDSF